MISDMEIVDQKQKIEREADYERVNAYEMLEMKLTGK